MRIKEFNGTQNPLREAKRFVRWVAEILGIESRPKIVYSNDLSKVKDNHTFGATKPTGEIWVYIGERNTADVLRTLCHELVHYAQFSRGTAHSSMTPEVSQRIEDEANAVAGRILRIYGKKRPSIYESKTGSLQLDVVAAMPSTYVIPALKNQDPYGQYRFGVAIAGAKGADQRKKDEVPEFQSTSVWGENLVVSSFDPDIGKYIDDALKQIGIKGKRRVSTEKSEESSIIDKGSPIKPFKGYPR